ncbi:hypothetical protein EYF80_038621 [Liparis tanakae]|uniref:Uncharacterized protein n=1 Tax=Liparis tanakae TaxID=230148 RepID=A0A4Z2GD67_9TELE|nr:hypothetical protein EYF80_038621 [Liparis tanakae]
MDLSQDAHLWSLGVENATFPPVRGEMSLNSSVHDAVLSSSPGRMYALASFPYVLAQEAL